MNDNNKKTVTIQLSGRIDAKNAADTEKIIMKQLSEADGAEIIFDADKLDYISSAGLRVLMRVRQDIDDDAEIINVGQQVYDILETTGFNEIFTVSKKMRRISVDGCEVIGRGFYGTVYRIDEETIVKVYASADSLSMIQNEKRLAKTALIAGVPTAISYDIVRVGDSYGSVFELLNAKTFNDLLVSDPDNVEAVTKQYAEFLKLVHSKQVEPGKLGSSKEKFLGYLDNIRQLLPEELYPRLKSMLDEIPEQYNVIHGDAQMKNIMLVDNEPMLIDMDTLSCGHPIFDLQSVYVTYFAFGEHDHGNSMSFLGIPEETANSVWEKFIGFYFDTEDEEQISRLRDKVTILGCIRFLFLQNVAFENDPYFEPRVKTTVERLKELVERVDTLLY